MTGEFSNRNSRNCYCCIGQRDYFYEKNTHTHTNKRTICCSLFVFQYDSTYISDMIINAYGQVSFIFISVNRGTCACIQTCRLQLCTGIIGCCVFLVSKYHRCLCCYLLLSVKTLGNTHTPADGSSCVDAVCICRAGF